MREEYLEIEELELDTQGDEQHHPYEQNASQLQFLPPPLGENDDAMLIKLLKKFQMYFLYPLLKAYDITYRSLRFLSVEDINTAIRSVGHRAEFREKLFTWRRKRYRTNDVVIAHEKITPLNFLINEPSRNVAASFSCNDKIAKSTQTSSFLPFGMTQTAVVIPEVAASVSAAKTNPNSLQHIIKPFKIQSNYIDTGLLEIINEDANYEMEAKKPKLNQTTVELRETRLNTQLNIVELLDESLYGPVMKAFYDKNGYLERKHRDELIQSIIDYVIKHNIKLHCSDFNKIVDMIMNIFPGEEESRDYYFINRKGKRNPMGRLYTKYYNTLKRMRVRDTHQEFTQETTLMSVVVANQDDATSASPIQMSSALMSPSNTATTSSTAVARSGNSNTTTNNIDGNSNNSNSINTQIELLEDELQGELVKLDDTSVSAIKNFLRCQGLGWDDVKTMWAKTYLARQHDIEISTSKDILQQWPKYLNARGMELFDIDFRLKYSHNKGTALQQKWQTFAEKIFTYYQSNIKEDMCKGLFELCQSKPGKDTKDYIITVLLNAIMLPVARYRVTLGNQRKITIAEAVDLFAIRVNSLEELDQKRKEFFIKYGDIHSNLTPLIVVVGDININIHEIYVHFDVALYEMPDFISALDCCMKIFRVLNISYPSSNEYLWTFMQRYFYEIVLADDMNCPSMSLLITYLKF